MKRVSVAAINRQYQEVEAATNEAAEMIDRFCEASRGRGEAKGWVSISFDLEAISRLSETITVIRDRVERFGSLLDVLEEEYG